MWTYGFSNFILFLFIKNDIVVKKVVADYRKIPLPPTRDLNLFFLE
jgi:hypothetical protein